MNCIFSISMILGVAPSILLMYIVARNYTIPYVERPLFNDSTLFGLFAIGLVIGSILFFTLMFLNIPFNILYAILVAIIEMMMVVITINIKPLRGKSDSIFYGYSMGLGMSGGLSTGLCFVVSSIIDTVDISIITLLIIPVSTSSMLGACATNVGEGVARCMLTKFTIWGLIFLVIYNIVLETMLWVNSIDGHI